MSKTPEMYAPGAMTYQQFEVLPTPDKLTAIQHGWINPNLMVKRTQFVERLSTDVSLLNAIINDNDLDLENHVPVIKALVEHKADINFPSDPVIGFTPFQRVARRRYTELVVFMAQHGGNWVPNGDDEEDDVVSLFVTFDKYFDDSAIEVTRHDIARVLQCGGYSCQAANTRGIIQLNSNLRLGVFDQEMKQAKTRASEIIHLVLDIHDLVSIAIAYLMR